VKLVKHNMSSACPHCGHSTLQSIPLFPNEWACTRCNRYSFADETDATTEAVKRTELKRNLIVAQAHADKLKAKADGSADPEEIADSIELLRLYTLLEDYFKSLINLPFAKDSVRQMRTLDPTLVATGDMAHAFQLIGESPSTGVRLQKAELELGVVEKSIGTFHRLLPWWHEIYRMTVSRIESREAPQVTAAPAEPKPEERSEPKPDHMARESDARDGNERAVDQAWETLGPVRSYEKGSYLEVCKWIDEKLRTPCTKYSKKIWDWSWSNAWTEQNEENRNDLYQFLKRRRGKVFPTQ
jgi:hypothetical protein